VPAVGIFPIGTEPLGGFVGFSDPSAVVDHPAVGTAYEVAINGVGLMLADTPEGPSYERSRAVITPPRLVTEDTPFNDAFERYFHTAQSDWSEGAGQLHLDRPTSSPIRYYASEGVDPFEPGQVTLLHSTSTVVSSTHDNQATVVAGTNIYVLTGANQITYRTTGGTNTAFTVAGATTIEDLASDGQRWYAAAGSAGIFRGTTADPGTAWSSITANAIWYAGNRVCVAYKGAGSSTPNVFSTLTDTGTEEVTSGRLILSTGWTITEGSGGNGYVFFGAFSGDQGVIYRWAVGTSDTPSVAMELPKGLIPREVFWYQGQVMVRAERPLQSGGSQGVIFRCPVADDGTLTPFAVATIGKDDTTVNHGLGSFAATDRFVLFSWQQLDGTLSGVGAIDLQAGGWAKWLRAPTGGGRVRSLVVWQGRLAFSVDGTGLVYEQTTFVTSGWIQSSVSDRASSLDKWYDSVTIACQALGATESLQVSLSFDAGTSFQAYPALDLVGHTRKTIEVRRMATSVAYKVLLNGDGTTTPALHLVQVRQHAVGIADTIIRLPIDCGDNLSGINGTPLKENGPGAGARRAAWLESLVAQQVKYQDVDYAQTKKSEVLEVVAAQRTSLGVFDRHVGRQALRQVMLLTLRKGAD
jgi:hypothetical protein